MLTDEAQIRRQWQGLPLLGKLLGQRRLSGSAEINLYGGTSVSNNIFTEFDRLIRAFAIVTDQREVLQAFLADAPSEESWQLIQELEQLAGRLRDMGEHLQRGLAAQIEEVRVELGRGIRRVD